MSAVVTAVAAFLAFVGAMYAWRFVAKYRLRDWRKYDAGRHLMRFTTGIAIILSWSVFGLLLRAIWGDAWWINIVLDTGRVLIFGWVAVMMFVRYQLLEQSEIEERAEDGSTEQSV